MSGSPARVAAILTVALAALAGFAAAKTMSRPAHALAATTGTSITTTSSTTAPGKCHPKLSVLAHGQGSPDDLARDGRKLLVSDINGGKIGVVGKGHVRTLVSHIPEPEGIVPGPRGSLIVAAQKTNSILQINLPKGPRTTLAKLPLPKGKMGVDGINADGRAAVFVPDSARGRLYVLRLASRKLSLVASGMIRPVAAIKWRGAVVVADEYANAVWRIVGKSRTALAKVPLPDDLAVVSGHLIVNSLVGQVWEAAPHLRMLSSAFSPATSDPQGMVADGPDSVILADQSRNTIYRLSRLSSCL